MLGNISGGRPVDVFENIVIAGLFKVFVSNIDTSIVQIFEDKRMQGYSRLGEQHTRYTREGVGEHCG